MVRFVCSETGAGFDFGNSLLTSTKAAEGVFQLGDQFLVRAACPTSTEYLIRMKMKERKRRSKLPGEAWFVYILRCGDGTLYTGITKDVSRRCQQHNAGTASRYTRSRRPVRLFYQEPHPSQSSALKREAAIKAMTRREKLAMIRLRKKT